MVGEDLWRKIYREETNKKQKIKINMPVWTECPIFDYCLFFEGRIQGLNLKPSEMSCGDFLDVKKVQFSLLLILEDMLWSHKGRTTIVVI